MANPARGRYWSLAIDMEPEHEVGLGRIEQTLRRLQSVGVFALFDLNDRLIDRYAGPLPNQWPSSRWPWIRGVEAATGDIRAELERYLAQAELPHVAEVSGLDPHSEKGKASVPVSAGSWRTVILFANGRWIEETARHFPRTKALFEDLHPKANVGFSALTAHSHIETHIGPNRGALRFQLPVIVPGQPGDCRIRILDDVVVWKEAEAVVFDLAVEHEAWNDSDDTRVLLMVEIEQPLRKPLNLVNRVAQYSYRWHPSYRQMPKRIAQLGLDHDAAAATNEPELASAKSADS
jgi:beta-hydroxylase